MATWTHLAFDRTKSISIRSALSPTEFVCIAAEIRADGIGFACDLPGTGPDTGKVMRRLLPWSQVVWLVQDITPPVEGQPVVAGPVTRWGNLALDPNRDTRVRITSFPQEFPVSAVELQPGGVVVDMPGTGPDAGKTLRRYVPWSQVVYLEQDFTPGPAAPPPSGGRGA